ncbi:MAG: carboxymuconolactone decarboxylase family protein [Sphingomonadaceae bacterium]|nr:carboxymuconolactone decarboxylase family protein [Sphingomonadaceae bacterium]
MTRRTLPDGRTPMLFRVIGTSPRAWGKFIAGSLLDPGPLSMRARELAIFRTAARIGADYEWGMHATLFAERCAIDEAQLLALAGKGDHDWTADEAALIATVDALIDDRHLSDTQHARMAEHFTPEQQLEIVQLVGFYQAVGLIVGAFAIPPEPGTPHIPA